MKKQLKIKKKKLELLGTGKPLREFIHAEDLAAAILFCLKIEKKRLKKVFSNKLPIINIGTKDEISIKNLSELIAKYAGFKGKIIFDKKSPDGTFRKNLDTKIINKLGWLSKIKLHDGLKEVIQNRKRIY